MALARKLSLELGEDIRQVPDAKYGSINAYADSILAVVAPRFGLKQKGTN